jgi:hypothetical protein
MVEIQINEEIDSQTVMEANDVELLVNNEIRDSLVTKIIAALDKMSFLDMSYNEESKMFEIEASVVLCSTQDVATSAELQAQMLSRLGLDEDQILRVLSVGIETHNGF